MYPHAPSLSRYRSGVRRDFYPRPVHHGCTQVHPNAPLILQFRPGIDRRNAGYLYVITVFDAVFVPGFRCARWSIGFCERKRGLRRHSRPRGQISRRSHSYIITISRLPGGFGAALSSAWPSAFRRVQADARSSDRRGGRLRSARLIAARIRSGANIIGPAAERSNAVVVSGSINPSCPRSKPSFRPRYSLQSTASPHRQRRWWFASSRVLLSSAAIAEPPQNALTYGLCAGHHERLAAALAAVPLGDVCSRPHARTAISALGSATAPTSAGGRS